MKILCVGRNYEDHVRELQNAIPESPIWFWKPESSLLSEGKPIRFPSKIGRVDFEVEMALRIGKDGRPDAYAVAIDVTARDLQSRAKKEGKPWAQAKGFDTFCPLGPWISASEFSGIALELKVNGVTKQSGNTSSMIWDAQALLNDAATWVSLLPGDILLTGTPAGVGPINNGDLLEARVGKSAGSWRASTF